MAKAYSYIRISSQEQAKGRGIERQLAATRAFCEKHRLDLVDEMADIGLSAFHQNHIKSGALGAFLAAIRSGRIQPGSYLIIENLDRLSRAALPDSITTLLEIIKSGVLLATMSDGSIYSSASPEMQIIVGIMTLARGYGESARKSELSNASWRMKRAQASASNPITKNSPGWIRWCTEKNAWELIEDRVNVVLEIFALHKSGHGKNKISRILNERGVPTFRARGKAWYQSTVGQILKNKAVFGEFQPRRRGAIGESYSVPDGPPISGYYPAIMTEREYYSHQRPSGKKYNNPLLNRVRPSLLTPFSKCAECGGSMRKLKKHRLSKRVEEYGPVYSYLMCRSSTDGSCKNSTCWPHEFVERTISAAVWLFALKHVSISDAVESERRKAKEELGAAMAARADAAARLDAAIDAIGASASDSLRRRIAALGEALDEAEAWERRAEETLKEKMAAPSDTDITAMAEAAAVGMRNRNASMLFMSRVVKVIEWTRNEAVVRLIDGHSFKLQMQGKIKRTFNLMQLE